MMETQALHAACLPPKATYRYAPDKWSVNQVVGHLIDASETSRPARCRFARNDATPVPGFEQDDYVRSATFDACALADLAAELESVRVTPRSSFTSTARSSVERRGTANGRRGDGPSAGVHHSRSRAAPPASCC